MQQEQITALQQVVSALQARLNLNSSNSSKPPSTDGLMRPKPKSLRKSGGRATGGQEGHPGQTLRQVATPDRVVTHAPPQRCEACQRRLGAPAVVETRQVFELPRLGFEVTEHAGRSLTWVACHARRRGAALDALGILPQFRGTLIRDLRHLFEAILSILDASAALGGRASAPGVA